MADFLGPVPIPDPPTIGAFPLQGDYGTGVDYEPQIASHVFDQPGLKTEQRYLLGNGARRFRFFKEHLSCRDYDILKSHWEQARGAYAQFPYTFSKPDGSETVTARYENPNLQFTHLVAFLTGDPGLTLLEIPQIIPNYTAAASVTRFPDSLLTAALESQVQQFIPLIKIQPRLQTDGSTPAPLYVSNQRCTVNGTLFLPRLLTWDGIAQTMSEASDSALFTFGNADDIWVTYGNQINLFRARIQFSLFHVNTNYLIDMWAGYARPWTLTTEGTFALPASDGLFELTLAYPWRQISRTCWKAYKGPYCPSVSPLADCPKDYNACVIRGVPHSFGGLVASPQTVRIKDNSTGVWGFGRSSITSVSIADDTVYQRPVQEVYTDEPMKVTCDVAEGRDESEFYSAVGIVGEGPLGAYDPNLLRHTLDGQPPHDPKHGGGWRGILGTDPANTLDFFGLDQAPWGTVPPGVTYASGMAFAEIRRTDETGLQLAQVSDRAMTVTVDVGIGGWTWTAAGARSWTNGLANPVWVAVNIYLRAIGLRVDQSRGALIAPAVMEQYFDVDAAIAAAAICDIVVENVLVPGTFERQFPFRGVLKERKPLKDWLTEVLNTCLGYYTFVNGKLWIGIRVNSSVLDGNDFSPASILYRSLQAAPVTPQFNWLVGQFGDEEFDWALNSVTLYDITHASWLGDATGSPMYLQSTMNFVGVSNKSQCARLITTRLREELGGTTLAEMLKARNLAFKTTLLAMRTQVGDIVGIDQEPRLPGGYAEGRVQSWRLNPDFSIEITASCTTDSMYDLDAGPKPADVHAPLVPPEMLPSINGLAWMPDHVAPFDGDPLYPDTRERTFDLWQDYNITREGIWSPAIWVGGEEVINQFAEVTQPRITDLEVVAGGQIDGPVTVYVAVVQEDAALGRTYPSNLYALWIPEGVTGRALQISMIPSPTGTWTGWVLHVGTDRRRLAKQEEHSGALPTSYTYTGIIVPMTQQLPEPSARKVRIQAKHVWHSGIAGVLVTGVTAPNKIQCNDYVGSTDAWVGRILSAIADLSDGSAPLWNFTITGFDSASGTFTVSPDCIRADPADSVDEGDVLIMRSIATSATAETVEDTMWNNTVGRTQFPGTNGLRPDEEIGRCLRIIRGKGAGQLRTITGNTNTVITVSPPFETIPDATSIIIVEAHDWDYGSFTSELQVPRPGTPFELRLRVDNLAQLVALVGGFLVDDQGNLTDEEFAVYREIFIYGQPPTVREVGPQKWDPERTDPDGTPHPGPWQVFATDHTIRADTSANDVEVQLMPLATYQGRTLYLVNDNGPNNLTAFCSPGEFLFDGNASVVIQPFQTVRVTAG